MGEHKPFRFFPGHGYRVALMMDERNISYVLLIEIRYAGIDRWARLARSAPRKNTLIPSRYRLPPVHANRRRRRKRLRDSPMVA